MQTREFGKLGIQTSLFGFGCMRYPTLENGEINEAEATKMIHHAIENGVNYFDTAYVYHNQKSEVVLGKALADGRRDKVKIATKLPLWSAKTREDFDKLLDESLSRLQTDHVDFYLLHAINAEGFQRAKDLGILPWLDEKVAQGKIKYPSFSFHGDEKDFETIITAYPWKMAQIQMNIVDTENQATIRAFDLVEKLGVPLVIMEPLRGGALANPPQAVKDIYENAPVQYSAVEWAFRYMADKPQVFCILSGVSTMEQLKDNIRIFSKAAPGCMNDEEKKVIEDVQKAYLSLRTIGCTGCNYCQPCPFGVKIPVHFQGYDDAAMMGNFDGFKNWRLANLIKEGSDYSKCTQCGACESACPQKIEIIAQLKKIGEEFA